MQASVSVRRSASRVQRAALGCEPLRLKPPGPDLVVVFFERFENLDAGHSIGVGGIAIGPRQSCGASTQGRNPRQGARPARAPPKFRRLTTSVMRIFLARSICSWVLKG